LSGLQRIVENDAIVPDETDGNLPDAEGGEVDSGTAE
jgi:hypothetical protein